MSDTEDQSLDEKSILKKINTEYVIGDFPDTLLQRSKTIVAIYGDKCKSLVWAPNYGGHFNGSGAISGFALAVDSDSPITPDVFSPKKMFHGLSVFSLDNVCVKGTTTPITAEYLSKNMASIRKRLDESILDSSAPSTDDSVLTFETHLDSSKYIDKKDWKERLSGGGSFAGIFSSEDDSGYVKKIRFWLCVQGGNTPASEELYREMEKTAEDKKSKETWRSFFMSRKAAYVLEAAKRSRSRLLASLADAVGADVTTSRDNSAVGKINLLSPTLTTLSHYVTIDDETKTAVYHSATVDPSIVSRGIIQSGNPYAGITILKGPPPSRGSDAKSKGFGEAWDTTEGSHGAFPTSTGRTKAILRTTAPLLMATVPRFESEKFIATGKLATEIPRLGMDVYRVRDGDFRSMEQKLGYNHMWGDIKLQPVLVKIAST